jgi:hypothetical protein
VRPVTKLRHVNGLLQWQIYTFNGALKPLVYHYTAPARLDCITSPVYPVSSGWKNVTPGTAGLMLVLTSSRSRSSTHNLSCTAPWLQAMALCRPSAKQETRLPPPAEGAPLCLLSFVVSYA